MSAKSFTNQPTLTLANCWPQCPNFLAREAQRAQVEEI